MNKVIDCIISNVIFKLSYYVLLLFAMLMLVQCSNNDYKQLNVLVIGDSNAEIEHGWVAQLSKIDTTLNIINMAHGGNTIGFDNNSNPKKNELKNIDFDIPNAIKINDGNPFDIVLLSLGTNDTKKMFADSQLVVPKNFDKLIRKIHNYNYPSNVKPKLIVISPPPMGPDSILQYKFKGGAARVKSLIPIFEKIVVENKSHFINVHELLKEVYSNYAKDGVHMNAEGQMIIARKIKDYLDSI